MLPASPSHPASRNTRTHAHTHPSCKQHRQCRPQKCRQGTNFCLTGFAVSFRSKASKICWDPTASKLEVVPWFVSTTYFFSIEKNVLRHALMGALRILFSNYFYRVFSISFPACGRRAQNTRLCRRREKKRKAFRVIAKCNSK